MLGRLRVNQNSKTAAMEQKYKHNLSFSFKMWEETSEKSS